MHRTDFAHRNFEKVLKLNRILKTFEALLLPLIRFSGSRILRFLLTSLNKIKLHDGNLEGKTYSEEGGLEREKNILAERRKEKER